MPLEIPGGEKIKNKQKKAQKSDLSREKIYTLKEKFTIEFQKNCKKGAVTANYLHDPQYVVVADSKYIPL